MPLPANPSNGQIALLNGISYVYDGAKGAWRRQATSITVSDFVVQGNLTLASNVESTSSSTGALVISGGLGVSGSVYSGGVYTNSLFYSNGSPYAVGSSSVGASGSVPKITNIQITDSSYVVLDDTAVDTAGGYIKITGTDFVSGCTVLIGSTPASAVTFVSSTEVRAQVPSTSAGTYVVYLVNPDGGVAIRVNGITFSGIPSWVTDSTLESGTVDVVVSIQLDATGASTYTLAAGSTLPAGLTLSNVGLLSGSVTGLASDTTYNFTVVATDAELQDSPRAFSITIGINDEYFPYVSLLLDGEGTDGSQNNTFIDNSSNNFTITRAGNVSQGTFSPYGNNWSNFFTGSSYLTAGTAASNFLCTGSATGITATFEAWVNLTAYNTGASLWMFSSVHSKGATYFNFGVASGKVRFYWFDGGYKNVESTSTSDVPLNTWTHIAVTISGSTIKIYVNGVLNTTSATYTGVAAAGLNQNDNIGVESAQPTYFTGYISNYRLTNTVVYSSAFTPSTTPLTAISGTRLLTCQSNRFIDNSTNNFAITRNGNVAVTKFSPFSPTQPYSTANNGGSGFFDGTGDFLDLGIQSTLYLNSSTYTIEFWVYFTRSPGTANAGTLQAVATQGDGAWFGNANQHNWYLLFESSQVSFGKWPTVYTASYTPALNIWTHVAIVGNAAGTITMYINGVSLGTQTGRSALGSASWATRVGLSYHGDSQVANYFQGYLTDVRILKGTALYTSDFVPPTAPLTAISGTSLLLNFTNAGVVDRSQQNIIETVGNAGISTAVKKYGSSSMYFDGSGDYLNIVSNGVLTFGTGDFTIELWMYSTAVGAVQNIVDARNSSAGYKIEKNASNQIAFFSEVTSTYVLTSASAVTTNQWVHVAVSRSSGTITLYLDGTSVSSAAHTSNYTSQNAVIGARFSKDQQYYAGYIDDLRVTKGIARYTANFTPPTAPHRLK